MFNIPSYKWRGKTFKNVDWLCKAVMKRHPGAGVTFDKTEMILVGRDAADKRFIIATYDIIRPTAECPLNIIADEPK